MLWKRATGIGLMVAMAAGGLGTAGCKRKESVPTVTNAPNVAPPSTQELQKEKDDKLAAELYYLPDLGPGVNFTTIDGEHWTRYPESGILIHDLVPSDKEVPKPGQTVSIVYVGTFPGNNKEFDRNSKENPLKFKLGEKSIIKGLSMGLTTMHVGGKRRIFVPGELAYGESGKVGSIPPNQALIFEVDLLSVTGQAIDVQPEKIPMNQPIGPMPGAPAATEPAGTQPGGGK